MSELSERHVSAVNPSTLCADCTEIHEHTHFRMPLHLVHPKHGKPRVFDTRGAGLCPTCLAVWLVKRDNTCELVGVLT
jgi:hypothetical protein